MVTAVSIICGGENNGSYRAGANVVRGSIEHLNVRTKLNLEFAEIGLG